MPQKDGGNASTLAWMIAALSALGLLGCPSAGQSSGLVALELAANPGRLKAYVYVPKALAERPALVLALHGCTQRAADFDDETGWTGLADEAGFVLLLPEQIPANQAMRCFRWYDPSQFRRDGDEPQSIRRLVEQLLVRYPIDRSRIFVTGLSAGAAMTSVLLATHPDLFAGGAVVGGVPYACAANALQAVPCTQYGNRLVSGPEAWADKVRAAAPGDTRQWPRVAIWHDAGDRIVNPVNARSSMQQWTAVHGIDQTADLDTRVGPHRRRLFMDAEGRPQVALWITEGVGHATAIDSQHGCGFDGPSRTDFVADLGLCTTRWIARFWGLVE